VPEWTRKALAGSCSHIVENLRQSARASGGIVINRELVYDRHPFSDEL
jgi:hypothetical protein